MKLPALRFDGKTVLVTGASSGIGRELTLAFSRRGARVLLAARRASELNVVAEQCRRQQIDRGDQAAVLDAVDVLE